jgi:hypothetical protein
MGDGLDRALGFMDGVDGAGVDKLAGDGSYFEAVQLVKEVFPFLGISCGGNEKKLLELLTVLDKDQRREVLASPSKPKGRRELKNLECSTNFDGRGDCSSWGKGKRVVLAGLYSVGSFAGVCLWVPFCSFILLGVCRWFWMGFLCFLFWCSFCILHALRF